MSAVEIIILIVLLIYTIIIAIYTFYYDYAYKIRINNKKSVDAVREYCTDFIQSRPRNVSSHIWVANMPNEVAAHVQTIVGETKSQLSKIHNTDSIDYIPELSEINITGSTKTHSEQIFFTRHFDGPFYLMPCKIDRVIIAITGSDKTMTVFPNKSIKLKTYEGMLFDFDRTAHYIKQYEDVQEHEPRIILKLQFYINPTKFMKSKCLSSHIKWGRDSRDNLEKTKSNIDVKTKIGIVSTYIFTYMIILAISMNLAYILFVLTRNVIFAYIFYILLIFTILYHMFSFFFL